MSRMEMTREEKGRMDFFCSWSGGKDSCLALYKMIRKGHVCRSLFTMIDETGNNSRSHGLCPEVLQAQATAIALPLVTACAGWDGYEREFMKKTGEFKSAGMTAGVFGDIDLESHREWEEKVCGVHGIKAILPLWKQPRAELIREFIDAGFKGIIVVVNKSKMPGRFIGRLIDMELVEELESIGVDACGENGEYHSFVFDGPIFSGKIKFSEGEKINSNDYVFLPVRVG